MQPKMTSRRCSLVLLLSTVVAVAWASGCTTTTAAVDGPIEFNVTGGFTGAGDGTPALNIEPDGTVTRTPGGEPSHTLTLDGATMAALRARIVDAEFATLAPSYTGWADDYTYNIAVGIDGSLHAVRADMHAEIPAGLKSVIDMLLEIAKRPGR